MKLTIRARVSLLFALSAVLVMLLEGLYIYGFTWHFRQKEFKDRLYGRLIQADSLLRRDTAEGPYAAIARLPVGTLPEEEIGYSEAGHQAMAHAEDADLWPDSSLLEHQRLFFLKKNRRDYALLHDTITHHTLMVSAIDVFGYTKMRNLRGVILSGIAAGVLALALISWYWPKRELQPIADKIRKARRIGGENLDLRLDVRNEHDELGQLAITFNQMLDRIEQAFRAQQQFIRNASHELRSPLTALIGETELSLRQHRAPDEYRAALRRIQERGLALNKLITRLLILSRIEADHNPVSNASLRIDELLFEALRSVQDSEADTLQQVQMEVTDTPDPAAFSARGDAVMIRTAIQNVLENAIKYGEAQPIAVRLSADDQAVWLHITDQGPGLSAADKARVLLPFYRAEQTRHIEGIGIGLALVKSIMDWHGGEISFADAVPRGTCVRLRFARA